MKMISEHLGRIIAALAAIALLVGSVSAFSTDISDFFNSVIDKQTSIGDQIIGSMDDFDLTEMGTGKTQVFYKSAPTTLSFRSEAAIEELQAVKVNGEAIDGANYTLSAEGTTITLKVEYLGTLPEGTYTVTIESESGSLTVTFKVVGVSGSGEQGGETGGSGEPVQTTLATPAISIDGTVLTITAVENATGYEVYNGSELLATVTETTVDLAGYLTDAGEYTIGVKAVADGYTNSSMATLAYTVAATMEAGLYDANDNLVASWDTLVNTYGMDVSSNYTSSTSKTSTQSPYYILNNYSELASGRKLIISNDITTIGQYAFFQNFALTSVTIPNSVVSIDNSAFNNCINLTSIVIPDSVTYLGNSAFSNCNSLSTVTIGKGITSIGDYAFKECRNLTSVSIPDGVTNIGECAFLNCNALTSIIIPDSVTSIEYLAFAAANLSSVTFENPNGWWYADSNSAESGTALSVDNLANASTAATYLKSSYSVKYWFRTVND